MSLARDLVLLSETLQKTSVDLFAPIEKGGLLDVPETGIALQRLSSLGFQDSARVLRVCLQALHVQYDIVKPRMLDVELVATLPPAIPGIARPTHQVILEMLRADVREVILLGYELTDHGTMKLLSDAVSRRADVIMICDRGRGAANRVIEGWPVGVPYPRIFHDKERANGAPYSSMHAKCLLVDGSDLLITSANFTFHGLHGNIEIGVRLSGSPAAEARKIFSHLVESGLVTEI